MQSKQTESLLFKARPSSSPLPPRPCETWSVQPANHGLKRDGRRGGDSMSIDVVVECGRLLAQCGQYHNCKQTLNQEASQRALKTNSANDVFDEPGSSSRADHHPSACAPHRICGRKEQVRRARVCRAPSHGVPLEEVGLDGVDELAKFTWLNVRCGGNDNGRDK
jgi:hypothetical protein